MLITPSRAGARPGFIGTPIRAETPKSRACAKCGAKPYSRCTRAPSKTGGYVSLGREPYLKRFHQGR